LPPEAHKSTGGDESGSSGKLNISIPRATADRVAKRLSGSGFQSIDEYVAYIVDAVLDELESTSPGSSKPSTSLTKEDEEAIEQKLSELGYL
jgi:hypothetical protein